MSAKLETIGIAKSYGETVALQPTDLTVQAGEFLTLLGPSGSGKTTLLQMISGLVAPSAGRIEIAGRDVTHVEPGKRGIGMVFQSYALFPHMSVWDNVAYGLRMRRQSREEVKRAVDDALTMVRMNDYAKRYPQELSGGQQQRIGVIRALAADAPVLLMDEPFGAVDPINRESIQNEFFQMQRQLKKTVIMVSHDIDEAIKLGDRVAVFRRGKLVQYDHPDTLLARPRDEFVGAFVGADSTLKRLLLVKAGDAATQTETARPDTPLARAYQIMEDSDNRYLTVLDGNRRALGYVQRRVARTGQGTCGDQLREFSTTVSVDDNLRVVLSKMYQFNSSWMPVIDADGQYVGEVTQDSIADYLSSGRSRQQSGQAPAIVSPAVVAAQAAALVH
jgi:osmoprotectant transport system ATP-binding protein